MNDNGRKQARKGQQHSWSRTRRNNWTTTTASRTDVPCGTQRQPLTIDCLRGRCPTIGNIYFRVHLLPILAKTNSLFVLPIFFDWTLALARTFIIYSLSPPPPENEQAFFLVARIYYHVRPRKGRKHREYSCCSCWPRRSTQQYRQLHFLHLVWKKKTICFTTKKDLSKQIFCGDTILNSNFLLSFQGDEVVLFAVTRATLFKSNPRELLEFCLSLNAKFNNVLQPQARIWGEYSSNFKRFEQNFRPRLNGLFWFVRLCRNKFPSCKEKKWSELEFNLNLIKSKRNVKHEQMNTTFTTGNLIKTPPPPNQLLRVKLRARKKIEDARARIQSDTTTSIKGTFRFN